MLISVSYLQQINLSRFTITLILQCKMLMKSIQIVFLISEYIFVILLQFFIYKFPNKCPNECYFSFNGATI